MEATSQHLKTGWVWLFAILIFFFNTFLLTGGLTYTLLLTPVWFYLLYLQKRISISVVLFVPLVLYAFIHFLQGVDAGYYLVSLTMIGCIIIFLTACYHFINDKSTNLDIIFKDIAVLNIVLTVLSILLIFVPLLKPLVWYMIPISDNIKAFPRLKLFTSEASHYSFFFAPIAIYFYSRVLFFKPRKSFYTILIVTIPLLLSFSLGVLSTIVLSALCIFLVYFKQIFFTARKRYTVLSVIAFVVLVLMLLNHYYPQNPLFVRIHNIFTGDDTSARGRTYEAFILANKIAKEKSYLWGIGPGQLKLLGRNIIVQYYTYSKIPDVIRIPNAAAETIAYFGYVGFALRMLLEMWLYVKTKVSQNPYRMWLFLFVFIYQFTGSYITNVNEYIVWILAFSPIFPEYIKKSKQEETIETGLNESSFEKF